MKSILFISLLSLLAGITACGSPRKEPDIRQNPHPTMHYVLAMRIEGAPGPFDSIEGYVMQQVFNDRCVPLQRGSGATLAPEKSMPITLHREGDNYVGDFYLDQLLDEDYYGMGVCHWTATIAGTVLHAHGTAFSADISLSEIQTKKETVTYFPNASYRRMEAFGTVTGTTRTEHVTAHPGDYFSVTLSVARINP